MSYGLWRRNLPGLVVLLLASSCSFQWIQEYDLRELLEYGDLWTARYQLRHRQEPDTRILTAYQLAQLEHYAGNWERSNALFREAEDLNDQAARRSDSELWRKAGASAVTLRPFELAMGPFYRTLNFIAEGKVVEAVEEARWSNRLLLRAAGQQVTRGSGAEESAALARNPFFDAVAAMVLEWSGRNEDAYVAYRNAVVGYHRQWPQIEVAPPPWLGCDLRRTGLPLDHGDEIRDLERRFPGLVGCAGDSFGPDEDRGTVAIFVEVGWVPETRLQDVEIPVLESDAFDHPAEWMEALVGRTAASWQPKGPVSRTLKLKVPRRDEASDEEIVAAGLSVLGSKRHGSVKIASAVVEDLGRRAQLDGERAEAEALAEAILRAILTSGASLDDADATESTGATPWIMERTPRNPPPDRCWRTLPSAIWLFRADLAPGDYDIELELMDDFGNVVAWDVLYDVEVRAGEWSFFNRRVF